MPSFVLMYTKVTIIYVKEIYLFTSSIKLFLPDHVLFLIKLKIFYCQYMKDERNGHNFLKLRAPFPF